MRQQMPLNHRWQAASTADESCHEKLCISPGEMLEPNKPGQSAPSSNQF
jgi:hypothetical protein